MYIFMYAGSSVWTELLLPLNQMLLTAFPMASTGEVSVGSVMGTRRFAVCLYHVSVTILNWESLK